jgi:hypothetical protein
MMNTKCPSVCGGRRPWKTDSSGHPLVDDNFHPHRTGRKEARTDSPEKLYNGSVF